MRKLGWEYVPVHRVGGLDDTLKQLRAERDENTCRKDFTPSEAVAIGKAIEDLEKPKARERHVQQPGQPMRAVRRAVALAVEGADQPDDAGRVVHARIDVNHVVVKACGQGQQAALLQRRSFRSYFAASTLAEFRGSGSSWGNDDPWIVFFGPMLVTASPSAIHAVALHEWGHAYLWAVGDVWWRDEWAADLLAVRWGADEGLLLKVRGLL